MNIDIMIDLETLDNKVGAAIIQIAGAHFDRNTGDILSEFSCNIDATSCQRRGMTISGETVMWWLSQSKEAQATLLSPIPMAVTEVLDSFKQWIISRRKALTDKPIIWCHASFDFPILTRAFELCNIETPWGYRDYRDLRTVLDLTKFNLKNFQMKSEGIAHNALSDVRYQVAYVCKALSTNRE